MARGTVDARFNYCTGSGRVDHARRPKEKRRSGRL